MDASGRSHGVLRPARVRAVLMRRYGVPPDPPTQPAALVDAVQMQRPRVDVLEPLEHAFVDELLSHVGREHPHLLRAHERPREIEREHRKSERVVLDLVAKVGDIVPRQEPAINSDFELT